MEPPRCTVIAFHRVLAGVRISPSDGEPEVVVSRAAMNKLGDAELRWVVAHELGHAADPRGLTRLRNLIVVHALAFSMALFFLILRPVPVAGALAVTVFVVAGAAMRSLRRRLERDADRVAHRCCADDPDAGRRALTIVREASGLRSGRLLRLMEALRGYPPFEERIAPQQGLSAGAAARRA